MSRPRVNTRRSDPYKNFKFRVAFDGRVATRSDVRLAPEESAVFDQIVDQGRRGDMTSNRVLFVGPGGTGKTLAAEVIANQLGRDLYRVDVSRIVSKYIGETEKHLRQIFESAEEAAAVLFFDEADALFGKRTGVNDSHDRFANLEVAYLLERMDAYDGIVILATNVKSAIDPAFMRRLRYVVNFPLPG